MNTYMIDMHSHLPERDKTSYEEQLREVELKKESGILTCYSCGSPKEWEELSDFLDREEVYGTFAIHPWFAHLYQVSDYMDIFPGCRAVGELGLDGSMSEAPLSVQKKVLEQQLRIAADLKKPIVVHSDGRERETVEMILDYPGKILMHWFPGEPDLVEKLLDKDCYFTLGPDSSRIGRDCGFLGNEKTHSARKLLMDQIPLNRVFFETDGLEAIAWALNLEKAENTMIPEILSENMQYFAERRGIELEKLQLQVMDNFKEFC
ncbi:MAG: TatD family hydrolase [Clostridiales bacterium]|nr:TatD family hydrolase [Candidatus Blautia equi]